MGQFSRLILAHNSGITVDLLKKETEIQCPIAGPHNTLKSLTKLPHSVSVFLALQRMSDNISLPRQRQCTDLGCEYAKYILDIFSYVQPGTHGRCESRKQLFVFITRDVENDRLSFLQVMCSV